MLVIIMSSRWTLIAETKREYKNGKEYKYREFLMLCLCFII